MSYEILYKRFLVKKDNKLIPYFIWGSNNCYEYSGKRERNVFNLFEWNYYRDIPQDDLNNFLSELFDRLQKSISDGFLTKFPKSKSGFIKGFYDKIIDEKDLILNGERMEKRLNYLFKSTRKVKSDLTLLEETKDKPLIEITQENVLSNLNKTIFVFDRNENPCYKGSFKKVRTEEFGFFKSRSRRRYYYLSNFKYFKVV